MSDHDRGAYTPQNDAPLSFDARQARGRRAFPTTLVISLVILAGLGVAIFLFYRSGVRSAGEVPTAVGAPVGDIKAPAPSSAQPVPDASQGLQIYKAEGTAATSSESTTFAPLPEQPQPRPAPTTPVTSQPIPSAPAQMAAAKPAPVVSAPGPAPVTVAPVPAAKPPVVAAAKPAPSRDAVGDLLNSNKVAKVEPRPTPKAEPVPSAPAAPGAAMVQFGAFSSAALAGTEWAKLAKAYPGEMSGKGRQVESVDKDGKTLFRGAVSGFTSRADAVAFCAKLKADGKACIVR